MYGLDCNYFDKVFKTLQELLDYIVESGMDPNYEITKDGRGIGETAWDVIGPTL